MAAAWRRVIKSAGQSLKTGLLRAFWAARRCVAKRGNFAAA